MQLSGLSGADYTVLASLSALDGDRMPAHAMCSALGWEKSRLSHQLRRMENDGLIIRERNPDDARSTLVCLLPAGRAAIEKAAPGHVEDVRRNFIDLFTPAELDVLSALNERVLHHLAADEDRLARPIPPAANWSTRGGRQRRDSRATKAELASRAIGIDSSQLSIR
ncbi:MarR family winged helix-turn-helix transcriptional regulator [Mycolicibacterium stellerae]|uniref:MarR family winged helix-turn-helix transcriptional regulator n=1 Tax=Mycolicibacterium stellerae TaxID=2358193 RepID=UPI001F15982D|nr:MarR family transcriptional regulator [Mycolicibacterium stellerae]